MKLEDYESWDDDRLRSTINGSFELAMGTHGDYRRVLLVEAEFYVRELDRRRNKRAEDERDRIEKKRWNIDFVLEFLIVILILVEIGLSISDHRQYAKNAAAELKTFSDMQGVLSNLQESSKATATTMQTLERTTEAMNTAVQNQLALSYEPSVLVKFEPTRKFNIINGGRTSITLWGDKQGNDAPYFLKAPHVMATNAGYEFDAALLYTQLEQRVPRGSSYTFPLQVYIKNELGAEFVVHATLTGVWEDDRVRIFTQVNSILRGQWDLY